MLRDSGELQVKVVLDLIGLTMATPLGTTHLLQDHFRALLPCQLQVPERIGCSNLRGGGGELGSNKKLDLWLQLVCTKLKLIQVI